MTKALSLLDYALPYHVYSQINKVWRVFNIVSIGFNNFKIAAMYIKRLHQSNIDKINSMGTYNLLA